MTDFIFSILAFIIVFAIVVLVHEYGHFFVARRMGVRVLRFSIGFGPVLWKKYDKWGTEFAISAIPLGGYIKMLDGREGSLTPAEVPYAFDHKPVLSRIAIVIAGPLFNFLFAILAYAIVLMIGINKIAPIIGDIAPNSPAAVAGLQVGDEFVTVNHQTTDDWQSVYFALLQNAGNTGTVTLEVRQFPDQPVRTYQLPNLALNKEKQNPLQEWGITLGLPHLPAIVGSVSPNQPAALAGIQPDDEIIAFNGIAIRDWYDLTQHIQQSADKEITLTLLRQEETQEVALTPLAVTKEGETQAVGMIGITLAQAAWPADFIRVHRVGPINALVQSIVNTWDLSKLTLVIMAKMLTGTLGVDNLAGPISIAQGAQQSVESGWMAFVGFLILLSVNLGVINLLPVPMLDGGHLLYYVIEGVRGRPISEAAQRVGLFIGLTFIIGLMLVGLHNDIMGFWK